MGVKLVLNAGCGLVGKVPEAWRSYRITRLDTDPAVVPDILASIAAMPVIGDDTFDFVWCGHALEHLPFHQAAMALAEFHRVLKPGGELRLSVPDLQAIGGKIALDNVEQILYQSQIGPITALDILYGFRGAVAAGNPGMAHRSGYTVSMLRVLLERAGFLRPELKRDAFEITVQARKEVTSAASREPLQGSGEGGSRVSSEADGQAPRPVESGDSADSLDSARCRVARNEPIGVG